ncbi:venom carboxylesterase-6-like [Onthophagus taurus]|uniref:venom carboxylesterase-6-like n=1 Tax=Onthophagus taurus TaxID=166361 RepID=UPI0039BDB067
MKIYLNIFGILFFTSINCDVPILNTRLGKIQGIYESSYENRIYSAFYGVPYAKPPINNLRFEKPEPISPWNDVIYNATNKNIVCAQINHVIKPFGGEYRGVEDCLYLNIFTPKLKPSPNDNLDVIVFIHGGAFMYGSNKKGARFLMDRDIIFVTVNYRLGTLGFLSTQDEVLPGNLGLRDQAMALNWIKENILDFGGNPNSVTLTGLSAGGSSVHFHYFSPLTRGLFHRGISISGTVLGPSKIQENPLEKTGMVAKSLNCFNENTRIMIDCMKTKSVEEVVSAIKVLRPWGFYPYSPIGVTIEEPMKDSYLPDHPISLLSKKAFHDLPWINTYTSEEGLYPGLEFIGEPKHLEELEEKWNELAPLVFDYNYTVSKDDMEKVSKDIKKVYFKDKAVSKDSFRDLVAILSDRMFVHCAEKASKLQAYYSKSFVYNYYFSYSGNGVASAGSKWIGKHTEYGVGHGDDLSYIFPNNKNLYEELSELDESMKGLLLNIWTSFAKTGYPKIPHLQWIPVNKHYNKPLNHLHIKSANDLKMENAEDINRHRDFWDNLPIMEDLKLYPVIKQTIREDL